MNTKQREFITLRADGVSFDKIAAKLKTSKPTLIQWSKLFEEEINALQMESFIQIKEAYSFNTKNKYETLLKQLDKIDKGIIEADLSKASIKDLVAIKNDILNKVSMIERSIKTKSNVTLTNELGYKENLEFKLYEA